MRVRIVTGWSSFDGLEGQVLAFDRHRAFVLLDGEAKAMIFGRDACVSLETTQYSGHEVNNMTPEPINIPAKYTLERRPTCSPRTDERPLLRDRDGRVLATVEAWTPEGTRAN